MKQWPWMLLIFLVACGTHRQASRVPMPLPKLDLDSKEKHGSVHTLPIPQTLSTEPVQQAKTVPVPILCAHDWVSWEDWFEHLLVIGEFAPDTRQQRLQVLAKDGLVAWHARLESAMLLGEGAERRYPLIEALQHLETVVVEPDLGWDAAAFTSWLHKRYRVDLKRLEQIQRQSSALRKAKQRNRELAEKLAALTSIEKEMSKEKEEQRP